MVRGIGMRAELVRAAMFATIALQRAARRASSERECQADRCSRTIGGTHEQDDTDSETPPRRAGRVSTTSPCERGFAERSEHDGKARHPTATIAASILGSSLAFIDGSGVNVALPSIRIAKLCCIRIGRPNSLSLRPNLVFAICAKPDDA